MTLTVTIPRIEEVLNAGVPVPVARKGQRWSGDCLGSHAKDRGVYVIHHSGHVKYVGKTDGPTMSFGMRLRREFQETAAKGRHIYPKLERLTVPPDIKVFFFAAGRVGDLVSPEGFLLKDTQTIAILETVLIQVWNPEFQAQETAIDAT